MTAIKKYKKIVLAGGSGFLGKALTDYFKTCAEEIIILTRGKAYCKENIKWVHWDGKNRGEWVEELEGAALLVNLTGKNVNCRYTQKNKNEILNSRINSIKILGEALSKCKNRPGVWIQCASATIYRHAEDRPMDEETGETGDGFSVDVCRNWEKTFREMDCMTTRKVLLRIALVLGKHDGLIPRLKNMIFAGFGGKQAGGNQYVSWIHDIDFCRLIEWVTEHREISGTFNATAPVPVQNRMMMRVLRKIYGVPFGLPMPLWLMEIGAILIGTETELVLKSRWVIPKKLTEAGFTFLYPQFKEAALEIVKRKN